jgi:hypothetical protein
MKLAATFVFVFALVLGAWTVSDYQDNKAMREFDKNLYGDSAHPRVIHDEDAMRQDDFLGFVIFGALLASIAMFAVGKKP